jgi:predicted O-methyltransferase YrrM
MNLIMPHHQQSTRESLSKSVDSMSSDSVLALLQRFAYDAARSGHGTIVEIGAYQGASTIALAMGIKEAGQGKVTSIDPHLPATGIYGGTFSQEDHNIFLDNLERFGVAPWVNHLCTDSRGAANDWSSPIDLLWVDGDHNYEGVASDITLWTPFVRDQGVVIFDDIEPDSDVEAAIRDNLSFSRFRLVERLNRVAVFRKETRPRTLYLCGGMQSSGSTLVSWCFLQRHDLDGVYDMENALIHQDFSRVMTDPVWLKVTIGSFRLTELVALYEAQGWLVKPLLVQRDLSSVYRSLLDKPYGFNGATGDDPPIFIRIQRYLADLDTAHANGWPTLKYENLIRNPREELQRICELLGLSWDEAMVTWPKSEASIAYMANGNPTFHSTKQGSADLLSTITKYQQRDTQVNESKNLDFLGSLIEGMDGSSRSLAQPADKARLSPLTLPSVRFWGTRRQILETELTQTKDQLNCIELQYQRILDHVVFGRLLRIWKRFINRSFPAREQ